MVTLKIGNDLRDCIRNIFYPVGALFISKNNVNPSTFMGGTWVAVTNDYLLRFITSGTGGGYEGTSNTVSNGGALTVAQLPSHNHALRVVKDIINTDSQGGLPKANNAQGNNNGWSGWGPTTGDNAINVTGSGQTHTHPLALKRLNMYGWIRTT